MGEDSFADSVLYAKQRLPPSLAAPSAAEPIHQNGEEPYTIKCICGFDDDTFDGNVVLCDRCNSWQHISCYYFPQTNLEEDFEHTCVDCDPARRSRVDAAAAASRQADLRPSNLVSEARRQKRIAGKNHKKSRTRDLGNGLDPWPNHDAHVLDGRSDSPRDQGPPQKRPKTTHKHSASANNIAPRPVNGRRRSESFPATAAEQVKLPLSQCPADYLSPDFIRVHHSNTDFRHTDSNLHLNIDVTRLLSDLLDDEDAFAKATDGKTHNEVFQHFPQPIEELETPIHKHIHVDKDVEFHGKNPTWPYLTVEADLMPGDYVGELRGSIGRREEYIKDGSNQWSKLRHPDHFVFFHPVLPIYIDSRVEGTLLRYARRSCRPNLKMETIITGRREYRFCFTAMDSIHKGSELTIPWDTTHDGQLLNALRKSFSVMSEEDVRHVSDWVGTILAHFGGCACEDPLGHESNGPCLLAHFDRRLGGKFGDLLQHNGKPRKKRKLPKAATADSDHPVNSRASSNGPPPNNHDHDTDMADDRSQTHSTDSKSSRDVTPYNPRESAAGQPELSERDKRKLLQQEKLFEQMEHDTQPHSARKRKRNSGSNANTPTATAQRQFGRSSSTQTFNPKGRGQESPASANTPVGRSVAASPTHSRPPRLVAPRPVYCDNSTQTEDPKPPSPAKAEAFRKPFTCRTTQLLKRSLLQNHRNRHLQSTPTSPTLPAPPPDIPVAREEIPTPQNVSEDVAVAKEEALEALSVKKESPKDPVPMEVVSDNDDAEPPAVVASEQVKASVEVENSPPAKSKSPMQSDHAQSKPPVPPWDGGDEQATSDDTQQRPASAAAVAPMEVDLPPPEVTKVPTPVVESPVQTPTSAAAPATTALSAPGQDSTTMSKPSVTKKKMSLSDYLRRKTETPALERTQSQSLAKSPPAEESSAKDKGPSTPTSTKAT